MEPEAQQPLVVAPADASTSILMSPHIESGQSSAAKSSTGAVDFDPITSPADENTGSPSGTSGGWQ